MSTLKTNFILDADGGNTAQINGMIPVGTVASQTLTNKTLTAPTLSNIIVTGTISANSSVGTAGQVLTSNSTGTYWSTNITNLSLTSNSSTVSVNSDTGTDVTILAANSTTAGVLTADAQTIAGAKTFTSNIIDSIGDVRDIVNSAKVAAYIPSVTDNGKMINITTGGITINSGIFSAGQNITIYNNSAASQTITQGTSVTLRLAGSATTGNRTLALRGICTIVCVASNEFVVSGAGLT